MPGEFSLWQVQDAELIPIYSVGQCAKQLESIFPNGESSTELHSLEIECSDVYCDTSNMVEVIYIWNEQQGTYVGLPEPSPSPQPTIIPLPTATPKPYPQYGSVLNAFNHRDFEAVLSLTLDTFLIDTERNLNHQLGDYYFRAVALEALNRPDEALAEYIAIYEAAPDSAWGMLAALHLEIIETE